MSSSLATRCEDSSRFSIQWFTSAHSSRFKPHLSRLSEASPVHLMRGSADLASNGVFYCHYSDCAILAIPMSPSSIVDHQSFQCFNHCASRCFSLDLPWRSTSVDERRKLALLSGSQLVDSGVMVDSG
jgi:transposase